MSDETEKSFKVTDRRIYSDSEEEREEGGSEEAGVTDEQPEPAEPEAAGESQAADAEPDAEDGAEEDGAPQDDQAQQEFPLSFATFVISLGDSALIHLGTIPHPATGEPKPDMQAARQTIDILGILDEKTQGNLTEEEQKLMSNLLYTLRMQWIQANEG